VSAAGDAPGVRHIRVPRTARYAVLGDIGPKITDVWIVCHGYAQLATKFIERFRGIAAPHRLIVAPEALSRFYSDRGSGFHGPSAQVGASWMTSEDRENEISDYIRYLDAVYDEIFAVVPRRSVTLRALGFSQGTSTVARWLASGHAVADQVIIWAGSIPPELSREGAGKLVAGGRPLLLVAGDADQFITTKVLEAQVAALEALGVIAEVRRFSGGHDIELETLVRTAEESSPNRR
jgi:predicted esterase